MPLCQCQWGSQQKVQIQIADQEIVSGLEKASVFSIFFLQELGIQLCQKFTMILHVPKLKNFEILFEAYSNCSAWNQQKSVLLTRHRIYRKKGNIFIQSCFIIKKNQILTLWNSLRLVKNDVPHRYH